MTMPATVTEFGVSVVRRRTRVSGRDRRRWRRPSRYPSRGFSSAVRSACSIPALPARRSVPCRGASRTPPLPATSGPGATRTLAPAASISRTSPGRARLWRSRTRVGSITVPVPTTSRSASSAGGASVGVVTTAHRMRSSTGAGSHPTRVQRSIPAPWSARMVRTSSGSRATGRSGSPARPTS